jgi:hypothetical protein
MRRNPYQGWAALECGSVANAVGDSHEMNTPFHEVGKHATRPRRHSDPTRAETDERLTQELIAERRRYIETLEESEAFWFKLLLEATSKSGKA